MPVVDCSAGAKKDGRPPWDSFQTITSRSFAHLMLPGSRLCSAIQNNFAFFLFQINPAHRPAGLNKNVMLQCEAL